MKRSRSPLRRWLFRLALAPLSFVLGMTLIEASLWPTRWTARGFYAAHGGWRDPAYPQLVGPIEKRWAPDFRKNSLSLRGAEPSHPVVLALGDSCTAAVYVPERRTYAGLLASGGREVMNAGVPGFSSYEGAAWVRDSKILERRPKLVTIYYGWNDHWRAALPEPAFYWLRRAAPYSHLAAGFLLRYERTIWDLDDKRHRWFPRVPLWKYRADLRELVAEARAAGAVPVLITAPREDGLAPTPEEWREANRLEEYLDHDVYVRATRQTAAETGAGLVDFAAEYERRRTSDPEEYFGDFVHPNAKGHALLAGMLRPWVDCAEAGTCPPRA